jgi:hypothetical protein
MCLWYQSQSIQPPLNTREGECNNLIGKGLLDQNYKPTLLGKQILKDIDRLFTKKKKEVVNPEDLDEQKIKEYREKWPKHLKATPKGITEKFGWLFREYPEYAGKWDDILEATNLYLSEADSKWMYRADHFIIKQVTGGNRYALNEFLERVQSGEKKEEVLSIYKVA